MKDKYSLWLKASFALFAVSIVGGAIAAFSLASYEPGSRERCDELGKLLSSNQYTAADKEEYSKYCGQLPPMYPATPTYQSTSCDELAKIMASGQYSADQKAQWANCPQGVQPQPIRTCDDLKKLIESGNYSAYEKEQWANCLAGQQDTKSPYPSYTCDELKKIIDSGNYNTDQKQLWLNCQQGYNPVPNPSAATTVPSRCQDLMYMIKKYSESPNSTEYANAKNEYNKLCVNNAGTPQPTTTVPFNNCDELKKLIESGKYTYEQKQQWLKCQSGSLDIASICQGLTDRIKKYSLNPNSVDYTNAREEYNNLCINDETGQSLTFLPPYTATIVCDETKKAISSGDYTVAQKELWLKCQNMSGGQVPAVDQQAIKECEQLRMMLEKYSADPSSQEYADTKAKYVKLCYSHEQDQRAQDANVSKEPANFVPEGTSCKDFRAKIVAMNNAGQTNTQDYMDLKASFKKQCEKDNVVPPAGFEEEVLVNPDSYSNPFPDTDINDRQGKAAAELYRRGVLGGFLDGEFKGDKPVNRAEASKFLLLACGKDTQADYSGKFRDLMKGQWYVPYVEAAAAQGIIGGYADGTFRPANTVNRAEFSKMINLACQLPIGMGHSLFTDVKEGDWFAAYAGAVQMYSLYPDSVVDNLFKPANLMTRSEVAIAIYQYLTNR